MGSSEWVEGFKRQSTCKRLKWNFQRGGGGGVYSRIKDGKLPV